MPGDDVESLMAGQPPTRKPTALELAALLAPLGLGIIPLGAASLLGATSWQPVLGGRWPLGIVQESPLYGYPFSSSETVP